jgi:predicted phage gp36 major capsid-like protein
MEHEKLIQQMRETLESLESDARKHFNHGNKSAGIRLRKKLGAIRSDTAVLRAMSLETKEV